MKKIQFKINYQVKEKRKFEKFLAQYQETIGCDCEKLNIERYEKLENQFQAQFFIQIENIGAEKIVYEMLVMANKLCSTRSGRWTINGPHENGDLIFECVLDSREDDMALKWAHLELENR